MNNDFLEAKTVNFILDSMKDGKLRIPEYADTVLFLNNSIDGLDEEEQKRARKIIIIYRKIVEEQLNIMIHDDIKRVCSLVNGNDSDLEEFIEKIKDERKRCKI